MKRFNTRGALEEGGQRWFVCQALARQCVRVERLADKLLVSHRQMYFGEIHTERGSTQALVVAQQGEAAATA